MPFRFWRRVKIAPGVSVNLSRSGTSVSLGPRGARTTFGHGRVRQTLGLPGSGLFYTRTITPEAREHDAHPDPQVPPGASDAEAPVPWRATLISMAFLTGIVIGVAPGSALAFALVGTPLALVLAWLLRRHPVALGVLIGVLIVGAVTLVLELAVGILAAGASGGRRRRRSRW